MIRGIYTSASSMLCETIRQDLASNNLANVNTPGFKRDSGIFKELPNMELRKVNDGTLYPPRFGESFPKIGRMGSGVILDETYTDFEIGEFEHSGNELDCALDNPKAFFLIERNKEIRFTRDGVFTIDAEGYLTTHGGDYLLAEPEPSNPDEKRILKEDGKPAIEMGRVQIGPQEKVMIDSEGRVLINGQPRFVLLRGMASDHKAFRKEGSSAFVRAYGDIRRAEGDVKAGYLEKPNFSLVEEMVKMVEVARAYEANSKVIQTHDQLLDKAINQVGPSRR